MGAGAVWQGGAPTSTNLMVPYLEKALWTACQVVPASSPDTLIHTALLSLGALHKQQSASLSPQPLPLERARQLAALPQAPPPASPRWRLLHERACLTEPAGRQAGRQAGRGGDLSAPCFLLWRGASSRERLR